MFPEYRDLITKLKNKDSHFTRLVDEHNKLDQQITNLENNPITEGLSQIEELKLKRLKLKDELYSILKKADDEKKMQ